MNLKGFYRLWVTFFALLGGFPAAARDPLPAPANPCRYFLAATNEDSSRIRVNFGGFNESRSLESYSQILSPKSQPELNLIQQISALRPGQVYADLGAGMGKALIGASNLTPEGVRLIALRAAAPLRGYRPSNYVDILNFYPEIEVVQGFLQDLSPPFSNAKPPFTSDLITDLMGPSAYNVNLYESFLSTFRLVKVGSLTYIFVPVSSQIERDSYRFIQFNFDILDDHRSQRAFADRRMMYYDSDSFRSGRLAIESAITISLSRWASKFTGVKLLDAHYSADVDSGVVLIFRKTAPEVQGQPLTVVDYTYDDEGLPLRIYKETEPTSIAQ